jgi:hypothetical protein
VIAVSRAARKFPQSYKLCEVNYRVPSGLRLTFTAQSASIPIACSRSSPVCSHGNCLDFSSRIKKCGVWIVPNPRTDPARFPSLLVTEHLAPQLSQDIDLRGADLPCIDERSRCRRAGDKGWACRTGDVATRRGADIAPCPSEHDR